jgi:hypothetical protein
MTIKQVHDPRMTIGEVLRAAGRDGVVLESDGQVRFAVLPLDEQLIDYLVEHNPKFIEDCRGIRERMQRGRFHTHEEVKEALGLAKSP